VRARPLRSRAMSCRDAAGLNICLMGRTSEGASFFADAGGHSTFQNCVLHMSRW
jgi:hypothetical protein